LAWPFRIKNDIVVFASASSRHIVTTRKITLPATD